MNTKAQNAKKILEEIARKTAKDIGHELGEIPKRVPSQLTGKDIGSKTDVGHDVSNTSPIVEAMMQKSGDDENKLAKHKQRKFIGDKGKVEADIEKYERKREELQNVWKQSQEQEMLGEEDDRVGPGEAIMPTSKPSRGKQQRGKQKSVETRKSKR